MSANIRTVFLLFCLILYGISYSYIDKNMQDRQYGLQSVPPLKVLQAITGYFRQISSEIMFIKTSVFLGGLNHKINRLEYEAVLANNLRTITSLYPKFIDPYFITNGFLAPLSRYGAEQASYIFKTGIEALPDNFILRFYNGVNFFYNLEQSDKAADAFAKTSELEGSPLLFARLAAIFYAHNSNLRTSLVILQTMLKTEENEAVKMRYIEEIKCFEKGLSVQIALDSYIRQHGIPPKKLDLLVPEHIAEIPEMQKNFILVYEPPVVSLKRP